LFLIKARGNNLIQQEKLLSKLSFHSNGFTAEYSGTNVGYRWTKDGDGKITQLENINSSEVVPVTWGGTPL